MAQHFAILRLFLVVILMPLASAADELPGYVIEEFGLPPAIPEGPVSPGVQAAMQVVFVDSLEQSQWGPEEEAALAMIASSGDPRLAWTIADMMRFTWRPEFDRALAHAASDLLRIEYEGYERRHQILNHLIAWDVPSYPGYLNIKAAIFTNFVPGWDRIFMPGDIAWEQVAWGGVLIDDRPYGMTEALCNCIPAVDDPEVSLAMDAAWLADDAIVFGIVINGEARAYPRRIMEVREMVNDTLGGRDLAIPYCTLCGSAQAYFTDELPEGVERPILRTSGLLIRSNKLMYDVVSYSLFDTFLGHAVTGPLAEIGYEMPQASVITTTWGDWRAAYPDTTVLVESLALGRDFDFRNTRDAGGPIFPVGDVDPRLDVHANVVGVVTGAGVPVAFERRAAMAALLAGDAVSFEDVRLVLEAGGIRAVGLSGEDLGSHQAFWFAWSQFHPGTALWSG